ncbi:MAG: alpha/beta hydrolase [Ilumatobacteraceae bacterium]
MSTATLDLDFRYEDRPAVPVGDGVELYCELRGDGPTITTVNNFFLVAPMWRGFTAQLAERNRILSYDLRNQGASSEVPDSGWDDHLADLRGMLDALAIERTYLVGTSVSTLLCRDFALAYPERVAGLVLVGPAFSPYGGRHRRAVNRSWETTLREAGTAALWDHLYSLVLSDTMMERGGTPAYLGLREAFVALLSPQAALDNLRTAMQADDDPALLGQLGCPVLLLVGDNDFMWSPSGVADAASLIPQCRVLELPGIGHLPYWEATEAFEGAVQSFVEDCEAGR